MKKRLFIAGLGIAVIIAMLIAVAKTNTNFLTADKTVQKHIALIRIEGSIAGGKQDAVFGSVASAESIMQNLREAAEDPTTGVILLRINSPGGSAPAAQEIGEEILKIRKARKIPIITSMGDVAASGGYWIACTTEKIMANPATMTGSIGVIMETQSWKELYEKVGIKQYNVKSGPHKDMGATNRELTSDEKAILQNMVNDIYEQFIQVVSEGRKLPEASVKALADGRIFTGKQALSLKLVDALGNYYDAVDLAAKEAGIKGEPAIKEYGVPSAFDIFKARAELSSQQNALLDLAANLLQATEVQGYGR